MEKIDGDSVVVDVTCESDGSETLEPDGSSDFVTGVVDDSGSLSSSMSSSSSSSSSFCLL